MRVTLWQGVKYLMETDAAYGILLSGDLSDILLIDETRVRKAPQYTLCPLPPPSYCK